MSAGHLILKLKAKAIISYFSIHDLGYRGSDVAKALNLSRASVSKSKSRAKKLIDENQHLWDLLKTSIAQTKKVLQEAQSISDKLMTKRQPTLSSLNDRSSHEAFIYATAIKRVVDYPLVLSERINRLMSEKNQISDAIIKATIILSDLAGEIGLLKNEMESNTAEEKNFISRLKSQVDLQKNDLSHVKGIIVRQPPIAKLLPSKTMRNTTLAGVVGLFMFLFIAFFLEYIKKASKRNGKAG